MKLRDVSSREPNRGDPNHRDPHHRQPDERPRDPRHPHERRSRAWSPWLVMRYKSDDIGGRPVAAGQVFWASPDIEVKSSVAGQAVAGEPNTVVARVINLGKADGRPTRVDFYWADPSLGLGPAQMNYIGTKWLQADHHRATSFACPTPWVPVIVNGGHECLFVNVTSDILNDRLEHPFQPQIDRHAAQRNVAVIAATPGQSIPFWVMVNNIAPMMAKTTIAFRTAHLTASREALATMSQHDLVSAAVAFQEESSERGVLRQASAGAAFARSAPLLRSDLSERRGVVPSAESRRVFADLLRYLSPKVEGQTGNRVVLHEVTMDAFEQRRLGLELDMPDNAERGDFVLFHLTQDLAGLPVGGYTIVVRV